MEERNVATDRRIPEYLGFGKLDRQSFKQKNGKLQADYRLEDHLVYHVEADEHGVQLQDCFDDKILGRTSGKDLMSSFWKRFKRINFKRDPRFDHIIRKALRRGKVYVDYPDLRAADSRSILVPEGLAFELQLVIKPGLERDYPQLANPPKHSFEFPQHIEYPYNYLGAQEASIFYLMEDGYIEIERVQTVHFYTILAYLPYAISSVYKEGFATSFGAHRLRITDHIHRQQDPGLSVCLPETKADYIAYGIVKENLLKHYSRDQLILAFKHLAETKAANPQAC